MIHLLSHDALKGILPRPGRAGLNGLFRAKLTIGDETRHCYMKPLPDMIQVGNVSCPNQELVNEALGYSLAWACGFKVPSIAGVIELPRNAIPHYALEAADRMTAGSPQDSFLAWFCEDIRYPDLVCHFGGSTFDPQLDPKLADQVWRRISAALANHAELPRLVTFDEWLQNSDRHPGNLLYAGEQKLALIDHGRIFHFNVWQADQLHLAPAFSDNRVATCVETTEPQWRDRLPIRNQRTKAYDEISRDFHQNGESIARDVLANLMLSAQEVDHVINFLASRLGPAHIQHATGTGRMI